MNTAETTPRSLVQDAPMETPVGQRPPERKSSLGMPLHHTPFMVATAPLLKGINLVEASAGTGKTFAIAMLALRFVTEQGIPLSKILVVTFTKAASEELKERIRARLVSAREFLRNRGPGTPRRRPAGAPKEAPKEAPLGGNPLGGRPESAPKEMPLGQSPPETQSPWETEDEKQGDPVLESWREGLATNGISEELARQRLALALLDIDCAPVFTIHSFCQRMLQEQALESGQPFSFDLITDLSSYRNQVVYDFWRRTVYPLSSLHCSLIIQRYSTPDDLYQSVKNAEKRAARIEPPALTVVESLAGFDESRRRLATWWQQHPKGTLPQGHFTPRALYPKGTSFGAPSGRLRGAFGANADKLFDGLQTAIEQGKFKMELIENFSDWWRQVNAFLLTDNQPFPEYIDFLTSKRLREMLNGHKFKAKKDGPNGEELKNDFLTSLALPDQEIIALCQAREAVTLAFRAGLLQELSTGLAQTLRQQNLLSFDELIQQLARSLTGPQGQELRRILGDRYAAALIDEFQDTDDAQYAIFSTLFANQHPTHAATPTHYLYLIGDPKQAIYTFRGADIYSYFKARQQADIHWHLAHNYRSHPALVAAVNTLFSLRADAFVSAELPYLPVEAAKTWDDGLLTDDSGAPKEVPLGGAPKTPLIFCELGAAPDSKDGRWGSGTATARILSFVVAEIGRLLQTERSVMMTASAEPARALAPKDIAVLVRNHKQADTFQNALARAGIPAVMASQQSVFASAECQSLVLLLQALSAPGNASLLKTALTSSWFAMNGQELHAQWQNTMTVQRWVQRFHDYHHLWQERGFLAMMIRLFEAENVFLTLAHQPLAERRMTNVHHLLELIQTAETEAGMGPGKTTQWVQAMRREALATLPPKGTSFGAHSKWTSSRGQAAENTELRLESTGDAITIMTMHGVKGLEYPVVFCPFLWHRNTIVKNTTESVTCHDENMELVMDLGSPDFTDRRERALREELAEELRLAYVALTRARCRCYVFWVDVKGQGKGGDSRDSALAWLLGLEQSGSLSEQIARLKNSEGSISWVTLEVELDEPVPITQRPEHTETLSPLVFTGHNLHTDRLLHSYSSLVADAPKEVPLGDAPQAPRRTTPWGNESLREEDFLSELPTPFAPYAQATEEAPAEDAATSAIVLPDLPKGAALGNVIHSLLEKLPFSLLAAGAGYETVLQRQCSWFGLEISAEKLATLLQKTVLTPLSGPDQIIPPFCLADLAPTDILQEMPFYCRLQSNSTEQINTLLAGLPTVAPVTAQALKGYLTGFMDLVCRHQGKFYIMDYKSNFLGRHLADYHPKRMEQAMREHNYGLQYWLYTVMLHRYLHSSMEDYDYRRDFGGVLYLFVRGMEPAQPGSGVYYDRPDFATLENLDRCLGGKTVTSWRMN